MPIFLLCIRAELDSVAALTLADTSVSFCLDVRESAGAEERHGIHVCETDSHDLAGSKGTAHFVLKFDRGSKHQATMNVMYIKGVTRDYTADDERKFVPIAAFECRGLEPIAFHPEAQWRVKSSGSGQSYEDVDLSSGEWCDYDEKAGVSVGIYKFESRFELHKG